MSFWDLTLTKSGPPLSPWQASLPPAVNPAHSMFFVIESGPYRFLQNSRNTKCHLQLAILFNNKHSTVAYSTDIIVCFLLALFVGHDLDGDLLEGRAAPAVPGCATPTGGSRIRACGKTVRVVTI